MLGAVWAASTPAKGALYNLWAEDITKASVNYADQEQVTITSTANGVTSSAIFATITSPINSSSVGGGGGPGLISVGSSGSGTYTRVFAAEQTGGQTVEKAYNGSELKNGVEQNGTPSQQDIDWDQKNGVGSPIFRVGEVRVVQYNSVYYFELLFDGQENDTAISIDEILIFTTGSGNRIDINDTFVTNNPDPSLANLITEFNNAGATLRYSLDSLDSNNAITEDNSILWETSTGSGAGDLGFYLPVASVTNFFGGNLSNPAGLTDRFYAWVQFGGEGNLTRTSNNSTVNFGGASTYEEFAFIKNNTTLESFLPEPTTGTAAGLLLAGSAFFRYGSRRRARAAKA